MEGFVIVFIFLYLFRLFVDVVRYFRYLVFLEMLSRDLGFTLFIYGVIFVICIDF